MRHFETTIEIAATPARVWSVMRDVERWHEWTPTVRSVRLRPPGLFGVGSRAVIRQPGFPPALWTVTEIADMRGFTWVSVGPGFSVIARHGVTPSGTGTRATLSLEFKGLFGGVFGWLTRSVNARYLGIEAAGLKQRSESTIPH